MTADKIRNFAIIAHIDHGKSTLADRFLEITKTVSKEKLVNQFLDQLSLERERGITIKMQPVRMSYFLNENGVETEYDLNLIDTPGHVDFSYEVSRALAAVEGVILLIDGTQGIQAQTIAHLQVAQNLGLKIIVAINKIDLVTIELETLISDIKNLVGLDSDEDIYLISAKLGTGVAELLEAVIKKIPPPRVQADPKADNAQALIFDSHFDSYKGIIAHVRVFGGDFEVNKNYILKSKNFIFKSIEVGYFKPELKPLERIDVGEIGYLATGIKSHGLVKIGDTIVQSKETSALPGYKEPQPVVFASIFPSADITYDNFQNNLNKLRLTDPAIELTPISSTLFGRGYLLGCLGLLHLEIFEERLRREFGTELILTLPSVNYLVKLNSGQTIEVRNPQEMPGPETIIEIKEPWAKVLLVAPLAYLEKVLNLIKIKDGLIRKNESAGSFVLVEAELNVDELISGFYDELKSVSAGYASLEWQFLEYRFADLAKVDILIAEEKEASLSRIIEKSRAEITGRKILKELKKLLPQEQFPIKLQAAIGGKIIARETIPALKANVTGALYGGDRTRKVKLWQKQKKGKKKLVQLGRGQVKVSSNILIKIMKVR